MIPMAAGRLNLMRDTLYVFVKIARENFYNAEWADDNEIWIGLGNLYLSKPIKTPKEQS